MPWGRRRGAEPAGGDPPSPILFDRTTALGLGLFLGLSTVFLERLFPPHPARAPVAAPDRSPLAIARRALGEFNEDRIPAVAAGAAFYALLALFPALGVFVSLYGLVADVAGAQRQVAALSGVLPAGGVSVLGDQMTRLAAAPPASLGLTFAVSLALSLLSSNAGMKAVIGGLNVAFEVRESRGFLMVNLVSLGFTLGAILLVIAAMLIISAAPQVLADVGLGGWVAASWLRWPAMIVTSAIAISLLYRLAPALRGPRFRWITPGGVFAALAWAAMSFVFSLYVGRFGTYDRTYGSLGALAGFMTWIWLSLTVILLGAELNCELDRAVPKRPRGGSEP
ncbi:YihY/virulence factor BrkB family protein [Phenylobacterium sp.]|uniref:YihY/virulence factor BrkB family protein n=1 Tax=Phenylobacterium sp. TaxID=1871053 RepID=UPI002F3E435E